MSAFAPLIIFGFLIMFFFMADGQLLLVSSSSVEMLLRIKDSAAGDREASISLEVVQNSQDAIVARLVPEGEAIRVDELGKTDVLVAYRSTSNERRMEWRRYGSPDGWRLLNVSLSGRPEILNPVDVSSGSGLIDPAETAYIEVWMPPDYNASSGAMLILVTPSGAVGEAATP